MTSPNPLDYANPLYDKPRPISGAAVFALIAGLCTGSIWLVLAYLPMMACGFAALDVGEIIVAICGVVLAAYCGFTFFQLGNPQSPRGRILAMTGLVAVAAWTLIIIGFLTSLHIP